MKLHFTKMHGCGNDYIYLNGFTQQVLKEEKPALARRLSDRHFGIGGDGVIFINSSDIADFEMEMYNADGSRGEMCGNGIRCVGKYVYDRGMTGGRTTFTVESCGKIKVLELACEGGKALTVQVNMGAPILKPAEVPAIPSKDAPADAPILSQPIGVGGRIWQMTCVSMGNPHTVLFLTQDEIAEWYETDHRDARGKAAEGALPSACGNDTAYAGVKAPGIRGGKESGPAGGADGSKPGNAVPVDAPSLWDLDLTGVGPLFENHSRFPNRTNTEFVQVVDRRHVRMRVWERGTGETLACGTGACAAAVAGVLNGLTDRRIEAELAGGTLLIEWEEGGGDVFLTGPAEEVFEGTINI